MIELPSWFLIVVGVAVFAAAHRRRVSPERPDSAQFRDVTDLYRARSALQGCRVTRPDGTVVPALAATTLATGLARWCERTRTHNIARGAFN
jgi:hypothetical protein